MPELKVLPCVDSDAMADARRRELDVPRAYAADLGRTAVEAAHAGAYHHGAQRVAWGDAVRAARAAKISIPPDAELPAAPASSFAETRVQVTNETTLGAARRLADAGANPLALNFANGVHPGGGFLEGARAQEEALCRSSALAETLVGDPMYRAHVQRPRPDSSDWAIYSPGVPVFRTDEGATLPQPWKLDFVTCAAPYAPAVGQPESGDLLEQRIVRVLAIARAYGHASLVLGAWGCGAFRNDPVRTANDFRAALEGAFAGAFAEVVFAVVDWSPARRTLGPFCNAFSVDT